MVTLFFAMKSLPATIVSSIAAIQPLCVVVFENIVDRRMKKISKDVILLPKLGAIILIVAGLVLLYVSEFI
jgi:drug/metabolite transporter (DMT)-like permease